MMHGNGASCSSVIHDHNFKHANIFSSSTHHQTDATRHSFDEDDIAEGMESVNARATHARGGSVTQR